VASEAKPFASLSSGLLARKGAARPAMKPQGFGQMGGGNLEDLGWNDMGFEPPKPASAPRDADHDAFGDDVVEHPRAHPTGLTPVDSPVHSQQAEIEDRLSADDDSAEDEIGEIADESGEDEIDETAELYEPEEEVAPLVDSPVVDEAPAIAARPIGSLAIEPSAIEAPLAAVRPARVPSPRSAPGSKSKAAFTLRLDKGRHLKLRLACAVNGRSAQQLVTDALDALLEGMPELDVMAAKAARKG